MRCDSKRTNHAQARLSQTRRAMDTRAPAIALGLQLPTTSALSRQTRRRLLPKKARANPKSGSSPSPRLPSSPSAPCPGTLATHTSAETHVRKKMRRIALSQQLLTICASSRHTRHQRRRVSGVGMTCGTEGPRTPRFLERHCSRAQRASSAGLTAEAAHAEEACALSSRDASHHTPPCTSILYTTCTSYFLVVSSQPAYLVLLAPPQVVARALPVRGMVDVAPQHIVRCEHDVSCRELGGRDYLGGAACGAQKSKSVVWQSAPPNASRAAGRPMACGSYSECSACSALLSRAQRVQ